MRFAVLLVLVSSLARADDEPVALAIVFPSQDFECLHVDEECPPLRSALVRRGLDLARDAQIRARGTAVLVAYAEGARLVHPPRPLAELEGAWIGPPDVRAVGTDLVLGLDAAIEQLERSPEPRRALIVISDGNDTNNDLARTQLPRLATRARDAGIHVEALLHRTVISAESNVLPLLVVRSTEAHHDLPQQLSAAIHRVTRLPALPRRAPATATARGGLHHGFPWWLVAAAIGVLAAGTVVVVRARHARASPPSG